jgi:hypothetical protein
MRQKFYMGLYDPPRLIYTPTQSNAVGAELLPLRANLTGFLRLLSAQRTSPLHATIAIRVCARSPAGRRTLYFRPILIKYNVVAPP